MPCPDYPWNTFLLGASVLRHLPNDCRSKPHLCRHLMFRLKPGSTAGRRARYSGPAVHAKSSPSPKTALSSETTAFVASVLSGRELRVRDGGDQVGCWGFRREPEDCTV